MTQVLGLSPVGRVKANCPIVHAVADHLEGADHAIWRERRAAVSRPGADTAATRLPKRVPGCATAWLAHRLHVGFPFSQAKSWHLCTFRDRSWHFDDDRGPIICATAD